MEATVTAIVAQAVIHIFSLVICGTSYSSTHSLSHARIRCSVWARLSLADKTPNHPSLAQRLISGRAESVDRFRVRWNVFPELHRLSCRRLMLSETSLSIIS